MYIKTRADAKTVSESITILELAFKRIKKIEFIKYQIKMNIILFIVLSLISLVVGRPQPPSPYYPDYSYYPYSDEEPVVQTESTKYTTHSYGIYVFWIIIKIYLIGKNEGILQL